VLRVGSNVLLLDASAGVVVRVTKPGRDTNVGLRFARTAHDMGLPVLVSLTATPLLVNGFQVSLWPRVETTGQEVDYVWLGSVVADLHAHADVLIERVNPDRTLASAQLDKVGHRLTALRMGGTITRSDLALLGDAYAQVRRDWPRTSEGTDVLLHGDLYAGNVLNGPDGSVLIDFDEICIGPRGWDHVPIATQVARFGLPPERIRDFEAGYGFSFRDDPGLAVMVRLRELASVTWVAQLAATRPELVAEVERRLQFWRRTPEPPTWTPG